MTAPISSRVLSLLNAFPTTDQRDVMRQLLVEMYMLRQAIIDLKVDVSTHVHAVDGGARSSGTITFVSAAAGDDITVGDVTFVATNGTVVEGEATYNYAAGTDAQVCEGFVGQVLAHPDLVGVVTASEAGSNVATITAYDAGVAGDDIVLTSVDGVTTAVTGAGTLENGADPDIGSPPVTTAHDQDVPYPDEAWLPADPPAFKLTE